MQMGSVHALLTVAVQLSLKVNWSELLHLLLQSAGLELKRHSFTCRKVLTANSHQFLGFALKSTICASEIVWLPYPSMDQTASIACYRLKKMGEALLNYCDKYTNDDFISIIFNLNSPKLHVLSSYYLNAIWESEGNCLVLILYVSKTPEQSGEVLLISTEVWVCLILFVILWGTRHRQQVPTCTTLQLELLTKLH